MSPSLRLIVDRKLVKSAAICPLFFLLMLGCHFLAIVDGENFDHGYCASLPYKARIFEVQEPECDDVAAFSNGPEFRQCKIPGLIREPVPKAPDATVPWDRNYMNLYTPMPDGGLVVRADGMHADLRITGPNQAFGHFQSKYRFLYGYFSMYMKLIPRNSAGVIAAYYFSSPETRPRESDRHDEVDFEFLGNTTGKTITLQTNIYVNGVANREQHHYLSFDPSAKFHKYSLLWNKHLIIWYVDDKIIRVFHNKSNETAVPYPVNRPMAVQASIWDGSEWATQGGRVKLNYTLVPYVAQCEGFNGVDGCQACPASPATACDGVDFSRCNDEAQKYWFQEQKVLTSSQIKQLRKHSSKYIIYDYCTDMGRFPSGIPEECRYNSFY